VVETVNRSGVFYGTDGFLSEVHARPGDLVRKDDPIVTLTSPELSLQRDAVLARMEELEIEERAARKKNDPKVVKVASQQISIYRKKPAAIDDRTPKLVVRAPQDGRIVTGAPQPSLGAFVKRGARLCEVVDTDHIRIAASLDNRQGDWLNELTEAQY